MKLRVRTYTIYEIVEQHVIEVPADTDEIEIDTMSDIRVKFIKQPEQKPKESV